MLRCAVRDAEGQTLGAAASASRSAPCRLRQPAPPSLLPRHPHPSTRPRPPGRSGADKVSIGSDAVYAVEAYLAGGGAKDGSTAIEQISRVYGAQAVVISIDPRRVYVAAPEDTPHHTVKTSKPGAAAAGRAGLGPA